MDIGRQIAYWRAGAEEDFDTAVILMDKNRIRHALFFAELALEKMLKAHVAKVTGDVPPRTHNLMRLAELAKLPLTAAQRELYSHLAEYCLEGRYPEDKLEPIEPQISKSDMEDCRREIAWLKNRLS